MPRPLFHTCEWRVHVCGGGHAWCRYVWGNPSPPPSPLIAGPRHPTTATVLPPTIDQGSHRPLLLHHWCRGICGLGQRTRGQLYQALGVAPQLGIEHDLWATRYGVRGDRGTA